MTNKSHGLHNAQTETNKHESHEALGPCWSLFCYLRQPFHSQDFIGNSPNCFTYNSYPNSSENLVLDQLIIPLLMYFFILITCLFDIVLIL